MCIFAVSEKKLRKKFFDREHLIVADKMRIKSTDINDRGAQSCTCNKLLSLFSCLLKVSDKFKFFYWRDNILQQERKSCLEFSKKVLLLFPPTKPKKSLQSMKPWAKLKLPKFYLWNKSKLGLNESQNCLFCIGTSPK